MTTPRDALTAALADVQHYSLEIEPDDSAYMELDPDGRYILADSAAAILAALAEQGYAVTRSEAGLDVERLARAVFAVGDLDEYVNVHGLAKDLAAEYARLAADPEPSE